MIQLVRFICLITLCSSLSLIGLSDAYSEGVSSSATKSEDCVKGPELPESGAKIGVSNEDLRDLEQGLASNPQNLKCDLDGNGSCDNDDLRIADQIKHSGTSDSASSNQSKGQILQQLAGLAQQALGGGGGGGAGGGGGGGGGSGGGTGSGLKAGQKSKDDLAIEAMTEAEAEDKMREKAGEKSKDEDKDKDNDKDEEQEQTDEATQKAAEGNEEQKDAVGASGLDGRQGPPPEDKADDEQSEEEKKEERERNEKELLSGMFDSKEQIEQSIPPYLKEKWQGANVQNPLDNPHFLESSKNAYYLSQNKEVLLQQVQAGKMTMEQARTIYAQNLYGAETHFNTGYARDLAGSKFNYTGEFNNLDYFTNENAKYLSAQNSFLNDPRDTAWAGSKSKADILMESSHYYADWTTLQQGNRGTCMTGCSQALAYAEMPSAITKAQFEALLDGKVTFADGSVLNFGSGNLALGQSELAYNIMNPGGEGGPLYLLDAKILTQNPSYGGGGLHAGQVYPGFEKLTGFTPVTEASLGGPTGFINGIQSGQGPLVAQRYSIAGHADEVSGRYVYDPSSNKVVGYALGDNTWGQGNERYVLAVPENAGKIGFPGGGGSRFGGAGGAGAIGGLLGGLGGKGGLAGLSGDKQKDLEAEKKKYEENLAKMCSDLRETVDQACIRLFVQSPTEMPGICYVALDQKSAAPIGATEQKNASADPKALARVSVVPKPKPSTSGKGGLDKF